MLAPRRGMRCIALRSEKIWSLKELARRDVLRVLQQWSMLQTTPLT